MNLLIVDDNRKMRELLAAMVAPLADSLFECEDGEEAIAQYNRVKPDMVLMDINMKGMNGIAAAKAIITKHPSAKIIIVTNYNDDSLRVLARGAGAVDYVLKDDLSILPDIINKNKNKNNHESAI